MARRGQKRGDARRKPATEFEMLERKVLATRLLGDGLPRADVRAELQSRGLSHAQAETTLRGVEDDIASEVNVALPRARAMAIHRLEHLTMRALAVESPNLDTVIKIEALRAKIEGTIATRAFTMTHTTSMPDAVAAYIASLKPADCDRILEEERAARRAVH